MVGQTNGNIRAKFIRYCPETEFWGIHVKVALLRLLGCALDAQFERWMQPESLSKIQSWQMYIQYFLWRHNLRACWIPLKGTGQGTFV